MKYISSFGSYSVKDVDQAAKFYKEKLDLSSTKDKTMGILKLNLPEGYVMLYPKGDSHEPATFTVLNLIVEDIEAAVDDLTAKGIVFEQYDNEYLKTNNKGIAQNGQDGGSSIAWFKDLDDNILSLISG
jgi:hypothetical protein